MDDAARGWLVNAAQANIWKLRPHLELDDLVQEGFLVLLKVERSYPRANAKQHMALLKRSFANRVIDLQRSRTCYLDSFSLESELDISLEYAAGAHEDPAFAFAELPHDIQEIATSLDGADESDHVRVREHLGVAA